MASRLWDTVTPAQRRFLLLDNGVGPFVINFLINAAIAWMLFRNATHVPMWGQSSIAGDTVATSFLLPFITCLIVTPLARGRVRAGHIAQAVGERGRWLPRNAGWRGALIGVICMIALVPLVVLVFRLIGIAALTPWHFVYFKASFAALEGALVTPFLALWAISDTPAPAQLLQPVG
jgi:hypothetical protein